MKKILALALALALSACSSDTDSPDTPKGNPPFSISLLYQQVTPGTRSGPYYIQDVSAGKAELGSPANLSDAVGLPDAVVFSKNGNEDILIFASTDGQRDFYSYNRLDGQLVSVEYADLVIPAAGCVFYGSHAAANSKTIFGFAMDQCESVPALRLYAYNPTTGSTTEIATLNDAYAGDSATGLLSTEKYVFLEYRPNYTTGGNTISEGLLIYNGLTGDLEESLSTANNASILVDGSEAYIRIGDTHTLVNVDTQNVISQTTPLPEYLLGYNRLDIGSIHNGKVEALIGTAVLFPAYYDFNAGTYVTVTRDPFMEYFNRLTMDQSSEVRVPESYKFDMESGTFAIIYKVFPNAASTQNPPTDRRLVYMDYNGTVLYEKSITHTLPYSVAMLRHSAP